MGRGRTNLRWVILFIAFVAFCLVSTASAQDSTQDQAAIEQALRDALPNEGDLPSGVPWKLDRSETLGNLGDGLITADQLWDADVGEYPNSRHYHIMGSSLFSVGG